MLYFQLKLKDLNTLRDCGNTLAVGPWAAQHTRLLDLSVPLGEAQGHATSWAALPDTKVDASACGQNLKILSFLWIPGGIIAEIF